MLGFYPGIVSYGKEGKIQNVKMKNAIPYDDGSLSGWPIAFSGTYSFWDNYELSNIQITQNISAYDTDFPVSGKSAILIANNVKAKITNATIADNGFTGPYNGTVSALLIDDGAEVELYNCILYGDTINEILISNTNSMMPSAQDDVSTGVFPLLMACKASSKDKTTSREARKNTASVSNFLCP